MLSLPQRITNISSKKAPESSHWSSAFMTHTNPVPADLGSLGCLEAEDGRIVSIRCLQGKNTALCHLRRLWSQRLSPPHELSSTGLCLCPWSGPSQQAGRLSLLLAPSSPTGRDLGCQLVTLYWSPLLSYQPSPAPRVMALIRCLSLVSLLSISKSWITGQSA